jgi:hypothetical protein
MKKSQEYLTKIDYTTMLRRIGLSAKPLSSYQIKKEMEKYGSPESQTPYVYEMIKNLCPYRKNQLLLLCRLDRIPGNVEDESKLVSLLNRYFQLGLSNRKNITFTKTDDDSIIIYDKSKDTTVKIDRDSHFLYKGTITILIENKSTKSFPLLYTREDIPYLDTDTNLRYSKPRVTYLDRYYRPKINFLDIELDDVSERIILKKYKQIKAITRSYQRRNRERFGPKTDHSLTNNVYSEIMQIKDNRRRWRYLLNVRGLVLYILGEIRQEKSEKRAHNKRISNVLRNLSVRRKDMPFLYYYEAFRKEYEKLVSVEKLPEYYEVELIKKISEELQYIVYTADIALLQYWVTRRYSSEISYYLAAASLNGLLILTSSLSLLIRDYQMKNLHAMKLYLVNHLKDIRAQYDILDSSTFDEDLQVYF